ncbi:hypothetical protein JADG_003933 [Aureobasidium aubasidani]|nr:hypothetical protein JADG_003933 [Aureobasidium pullulans]
MAQRGRVVIDLSEDSPPPPELESHKAQPAKVPDTRFITPSDDDDSDDGVMFLWGTRKQRHDTNVSNTLKSNLPTNVLDGKKYVTKPASTQPNISRPLGPLPNAQKPTQSSLVPPRSSSRAIPSASIPQQLNLPPGATPLPSTSSIPPAHSPFSLPPQFSRPSRPSSAHAGLGSQAHAPPPGASGKSMGLAPSQPVELFQPSPAPAPAIPALKHPALPPTLPSTVASDPPPTVLPEEISRGRNGDTSAEHARNNNLSQSVGLKPAPAAPSSSKHVSRTLASLSYPSEPRQPRKESETAPTSSKTSTSLVTQPPEPSQKRTLPTQQQATLPLKPAVNNAVDSGSPFSDDSFVTAVGSSSSVASKPASKSSPRIGKRKMEVIEIDDDEPLKRLRRTRSSAVRPKSPGVLVQPDSVMGSVEVDTHDQFTFPRDIAKIKPFKNRFGQPFTLEEDALVKHLKEVKKIPWKDFERFFPGRKWPSMQTRYSKVLSKLTVRPSGLVPLSLPASTREKPQREIPRPTREVLRPARELRGTHHVHANSVDSSSIRQKPEEETMDDPYRCKRVTQPLNYLIRHREIGATRGRQWPRKIHAGFKDLLYNSMGVQAHMDNASGDVSTVAWSPDGKFFAAGAVAVADRQTIDHSKPRNLVIGSAATQTAKELPQHTIKHMLPDGRQKDAFATVQLVAWSPDSKYMYSVGIDRRLHRYKVGESPLETTLVDTVEHPASVDFLSVSSNGLVATGCASADAGAIRVLAYDDENATSKAVRLSGTVQSRKTPSALKWGTAHNHQNYLLAGFSREVEVRYAEDDNRDKEGEVALWDMNTQQRLETDASNKNIFDLAWNPNPSSSSSIFAVASGTFGHVSHGIESVVRLYSPRQNRAQHTMELDCPAWDINDVIYSPHDSNLIAVGSTEGRVYIWDVRYTKHGQSPLSTLRHEEPVAVEMDTGIRFLSWGSERNRLYSGSSDGVVKCWDPYRHDSDKEVRDVVRLSSSVMSGAFSPDFSHLLLGEAGARLNMLSVGNDGARFDQRTTPRFKVDEAPLKEEAASGALDCQKMFDTEALEIKPAGTMPFRQVVQGPNYNGPYRSDSEAVKLCEKAGKFQEKVLRSLRRRNKQTRKSGYQDTEACSLDCGFIPLPDDYDAPEKWLSERIPDDIWDWIRAKGPMAEFACFRCGKAATITSRARTIECVACGTTWKTGALGYEVIEQTKTGVSGFKSEEEETESVDDLCDSEDEVERFRELSIDSDTAAFIMKIKALTRTASQQQTPGTSVQRQTRNLDPALHPFERAREYTRALNATKMDRMFAQPFLAQLGRGHVDGVYTMAKDPNSLERFASGSGDGVVKVWDLTTREEIWQAQAHENIVKGMTWTHDKKLLSCGSDRSIKMYDPYNQAGNAAPLSTYLGPAAFTSITKHRTEPAVAAASSVISIYDLNRPNSAPLQTLQWPNSIDTITALKFNQTETSILASTATDRSLIFYDMRTSSPLHKSVLTLASNAISWNPMEAFNLAVANEDHNIYIFDMRNLKRALNVLKDHVAAVMDVEFSPTGEELVSASYDRSVRLWKRNDGHSRDVYHTKRMQRVFSAAWTPDNNYILSGSDDGNIRLWRARASERQGVKSARQRQQLEYDRALVERYKHMPEIRRIHRHRHLPKQVKKAGEIKGEELQAIKRREENERKHSSKGDTKRRSEREKMVLQTEQ